MDVKVFPEMFERPVTGGGGGGATPSIKDVMAHEMISRATNGAGAGVDEYPSNDINIRFFSFDPVIPEAVQYGCPWPGDYNTFTAEFYTVGTVGDGSVRFTGAAICYADEAGLDQGIGTPKGATEVFNSFGDIHISPPTAEVVPAGIPGAGNWTIFEFARDLAHVDDTYAAEARLTAVRLTFYNNPNPPPT